MKPYIVYTYKDCFFMIVWAILSIIGCVLLFPAVMRSTSSYSKGKIFSTLLVAPWIILYYSVKACRIFIKKRKQMAIRIDEDGLLLDVHHCPYLNCNWEKIKRMDVVKIKEKGFMLHIECWGGFKADYILSGYVLNMTRFKNAVMYYSERDDLFSTKYSIWLLW